MHDFQSADRYLGQKPSRPLDGRSTRLIRREDGSIAVRYHETDVVRYFPDGRIRVDSGGWKTATTKDRINEYANAGVYSKAGVWYFRDGSLFRDKTILLNDSPCNPAGKAVTEAVAQAKRELDRKVSKFIAAYCAKVVEDKQLNPPSAGDCMFCQFRRPEAPKEEPGIDHLRSHIDPDSYYLNMGSLTYNAIVVAGYANPGYLWHLMDAAAKRGDTDLLRQALTRYFRYLKPQLLPL